LVSHGPPGTQVLDDGFWPFWIYGYPDKLVSLSLSGIVQSVATCNTNELITGGGFSITDGPGIVLSSTPREILG
jgi:hypothetical protein